MKQKLRIAVIVLMALSIVLVAFFSLFEFGAERAKVKRLIKQEGEARYSSPFRREELKKELTETSPYAVTRRDADFGLALIGGSAILIIGGLVLYVLKEPGKKET